MDAAHTIAPNDLRLIALLTDAGLPTRDLSEDDAEFIAIGSPPVAFGGIVYFGDVALLRSIVVADRARRTGRGQAVVTHLLARARARGIRDVWLLTETAEAFFASLGFVRRSRDEAPAAIAATEQFKELCPASAVLMHRTTR